MKKIIYLGVIVLCIGLCGCSKNVEQEKHVAEENLDEIVNEFDETEIATETFTVDTFTYNSEVGYSINLPMIYQTEVDIYNYADFDNFYLKDMKASDTGLLFSIIRTESRWVGETVNEFDDAIVLGETQDGQYSYIIGKSTDVQYDESTKDLFTECIAYYEDIVNSFMVNEEIAIYHEGGEEYDEEFCSEEDYSMGGYNIPYNLPFVGQDISSLELQLNQEGVGLTPARNIVSDKGTVVPYMEYNGYIPNDTDILYYGIDNYGSAVMQLICSSDGIVECVAFVANDLVGGNSIIQAGDVLNVFGLTDYLYSYEQGTITHSNTGYDSQQFLLLYQCENGAIVMEVSKVGENYEDVEFVQLVNYGNTITVHKDDGTTQKLNSR